jgi:hypothetical protein
MAKVSNSSTISYPDDFVSSKQKLTDEWQLKYNRAAWSEMEQDQSFNLDSRIARFVASRKLAEGLRSLESITEIFSQGMDMTYLNVNDAVSTPLPKLLKIATRTVYNQAYKPQAVAVDSLSEGKASNRRAEILNDMKMEEMRVAMEQIGVEGVINKPKKDLPKDNKELEIHMQMNPKLGTVVAIEYLIRQGFMQNMMPNIEKKIAKDLIDLKWGCGRVYFDGDLNLRMAYVDPARLILSHIYKEDGEDARHIGELLDVPITELREMIQDKYPEEDVRWIAENVSDQYRSGWSFGNEKYYDNLHRDQSEYNNHTVQVVHLQVKQFDNHVYLKKPKKNGGFRIEKKAPGYELPKDGDNEGKEIKRKGVQAIYEGYWVVGTDYVFGWHRKEEAFRNRLNGKWFGTAMFDYVLMAPNIYDMENKSIAEQCRYHDDQMVLLELKMQQYLIMADPPGYEYDVDRLRGAIAGMGLGDIDPIDMINIKAQTGRLFSSSRGEDNELLTQSATANKLESGLDQSLQLIAELYNGSLAKMKEVIGVNDAVDGSQPDKKALVQVQQLAAEGHKAALSDVNEAFQTIIRGLADRVAKGFQTQIRSGVNVKEIENSIGKLNLIEITSKDIEAADFDIGIQMMPTQYDVEKLEMKLQEMTTGGMIAPEDGFIVMRIADESTTMGEQMLAYLSKKFREEQQANQQANIEKQSEGNAQVAEMTAQMEAKNIQLRVQGEAEKMQLEKDLDGKMQKADWVEKSKYLVLETEMKERLIKAASESKKGEQQDKDDRDPAIPGGSSEGYDLKKDSIPKEAGKVEPSLGLGINV